MQHIGVHKMSGAEVCAVQLPPFSTVFGIKLGIFQQTQIALVVQKLLHEGRVLGDNDGTENLGHEATVMLVLDFESAFSHPDPEQRLEAVQFLTQAVQQGLMCSFHLLAEPLRDSDWKVRSTTVKVLLEISDKGDQDAIALLSGLLYDADGNVRFLAAEGLVQLIDQTDGPSAHHFQSLLDDDLCSIRSLAMRILSQIGRQGNQHLIDLFAARLEDEEFPARCSAVQAIARVANQDDRCVIALLEPRLQDPSYPVRRVTVEALTRLASKGNKTVIDLISRACTCSETCGANVLGTVGHSLCYGYAGTANSSVKESHDLQEIRMPEMPETPKSLTKCLRPCDARNAK